MDKSLRTEKEIIKMRESALSDWRKDLQEEHPYVELMPSPQPKDMSCLLYTSDAADD